MLHILCWCQDNCNVGPEKETLWSSKWPGGLATPLSLINAHEHSVRKVGCSTVKLCANWTFILVFMQDDRKAGRLSLVSAEPEEVREWLVKAPHITIGRSADELCSAILYQSRVNCLLLGCATVLELVASSILPPVTSSIPLPVTSSIPPPVTSSIPPPSGFTPDSPCTCHLSVRAQCSARYTWTAVSGVLGLVYSRSLISLTRYFHAN